MSLLHMMDEGIVKSYSANGISFYVYPNRFFILFIHVNNVLDHLHSQFGKRKHYILVVP